MLVYVVVTVFRRHFLRWYEARHSIFFVCILCFILQCCDVQSPLHPTPPPPSSLVPAIKEGQKILFLLPMFQFCPSSVLQTISNRKVHPLLFTPRSSFILFKRVALDVYKKGRYCSLMSHSIVWSKNAGGKAKHDRWRPVIVGRISRSALSGEPVEAMISSAQTVRLLRFLILRAKLRQSKNL